MILTKKKTIYFKLLLGIILIIFLNSLGCALLNKKIVTKSKESPVLVKVSPEQYPYFWDDLQYKNLITSIDQSLIYLNRVPSKRNFTFGNKKYDAKYLIKSLTAFFYFIQTNPTPHQLNMFINDNYFIYQSSGKNIANEVLFTGYYEPLIEGSLVETDEFIYPLYTCPDDLVKIDIGKFDKNGKKRKLTGRIVNQTNSIPIIVPYFDRDSIEYKNLLDGKAEVIAWVKDQVALFFLHIQGSGKILLDDGTAVNVHYHTSNGHPYRSIGKLLIDKGHIARDKISMQSIRNFLYNNPEKIRETLNYNPSYVFLKTEEESPIGCFGVKVTPGRSIALDRKIFPAAALAFIKAKKPVDEYDNKIDQWIDFSRFVLNQDTGGAIKGPGRADVFWGNGAYAENAAGHMQHNGKLFFLVAKPEFIGFEI